MYKIELKKKVDLKLIFLIKLVFNVGVVSSNEGCGFIKIIYALSLQIKKIFFVILL